MPLHQLQNLRKAHSFSPLLNVDEPFTLLDLTGSADSVKPCKGLLKTFRLCRPQPKYTIGRYNEDRSGLYVTELFTDKSSLGSDSFKGRRTIHVGVDFGGPVNTPVHNFHTGKVLYFGYNPAAGDYGHVVVLEHTIEGSKMWSLYGHLSKSSMEALFKGKVVKTGEVVGFLGSHKENGGWEPHVHFQLSLVKPSTHDMAGAVSKKDLDVALAIYPDPRFVLGPIY